PPNSTLFPYTTLFRSLGGPMPYAIVHHFPGGTTKAALVRRRKRRHLTSTTFRDSPHARRGPGYREAQGWDFPPRYSAIACSRSLDRKSTRLNSSHVAI